MNNKTLTFLLSAICGLLFFSCNGCSNNPVTGGSDMPNFIDVTIEDNLIEITSSQKGFVEIFSSDFNPLDSSGIFITKQNLNQNSSFEISLPKGTFNIFVTDSSQKKGSFIKNLNVGSLQALSFKDTLDYFGSFQGVVQGAFDSSKIFIPGSFFYNSVKSDNIFSLENLPKGNYIAAARVYNSVDGVQKVVDMLLGDAEFIVRPSQTTVQESILIPDDSLFSQNIEQSTEIDLSLIQSAQRDPYIHTYISVDGTYLVSSSINTVYSHSNNLTLISSRSYESPLYKLSKTNDDLLLLTFINSVQLANPETLEEVSSFSLNDESMFLNSFQSDDDSIFIFSKRNDSLVLYKASSSLENPYFAGYILPAPNPVFDVEAGIYNQGILLSINTPVSGSFHSINELFNVSSLNGEFEVSPFVFSRPVNNPEINKITTIANNSLIISGKIRYQEVNQTYPVLIKLSDETVFEKIFSDSLNFVGINAVQLSFGGYGIISSRPGFNEFKLIVTDENGNVIAQEYFSSLFAGKPSVVEIDPGNILVAVPGEVFIYNFVN